jgi:abortive infection bacteriophage resistance protein
MLSPQLLSMVTSILPRSNFHTYIKPTVNRLMNLKESTRWFVVIAEHPPNICPHSNSIVSKKYEVLREQEDEMAKKFNVERVFAGIAVPEHKTFMVFKAPSFEAVRSLMVQTGFVQTDEVTIRQVETYEEFGEEVKTGPKPIF